MALLIGFHSHAGHSYGGDSERAAMQVLTTEIDETRKAAETASMRSVEYFTNLGLPAPNRNFILSVGATPTATSIQNLSSRSSEDQSTVKAQQASKLKACIDHAREHHSVELHAGVYCLQDLQQLATQASPSKGPSSECSALSTADIALTILTEVSSIYTARSPREALIAAGSLALGREPCKSYQGWGVLSDWNLASDSGLATPQRSGWKVERISQEHGVLVADEETHYLDLKVGQKFRLWPNHACIAGAGFEWYLVVDSRMKEQGKADEIVDVWVRCRGW